MKQVIVALLILASLCVTASAVESLMLCDLDKHGEFIKYEIKAFHKDSRVTSKGDCYSFKVSEGWTWVCAKSKKKSHIVNIEGYQTLSFDIRVDNKKGKVDFGGVCITLYHWDKKEIPIRYVISRTEIPSDDKWYRVYIPLSQFIIEWGPRTKQPDQNNIFKIDCRVGTDTPVEEFETRVKNIQIWKAHSDEIKVEPLDK